MYNDFADSFSYFFQSMYNRTKQEDQRKEGFQDSKKYPFYKTGSSYSSRKSGFFISFSENKYYFGVHNNHYLMEHKDGTMFNRWWDKEKIIIVDENDSIVKEKRFANFSKISEEVRLKTIYQKECYVSLATYEEYQKVVRKNEIYMNKFRKNKSKINLSHGW